MRKFNSQVLLEAEEDLHLEALMPEGFLEAAERIYEEHLKEVSDCYGQFQSGDAGRKWKEAFEKYAECMVLAAKDIVKEEWNINHGDYQVTGKTGEIDVLKRSFVPKVEMYLDYLSSYAGADDGGDLGCFQTPILTPSWMLDMQNKCEGLSSALSEVSGFLR